jgi:hypothetical protein
MMRGLTVSNKQIILSCLGLLLALAASEAGAKVVTSEEAGNNKATDVSKDSVNNDTDPDGTVHKKGVVVNPGDNRIIEIDPKTLRKIKAENQAPFKSPYDILDPQTKQPISGDTILKVPTGDMPAKEYYEHLNAYQSALNADGHDLKKSIVEPIRVVEVIKNLEQLEEKSAEQKKSVKNKDESIMDTILDPAKVYEEAKSAGQDAIKGGIKDLYRLAMSKAKPIPLINQNPPQARIVLEPYNDLHSLLDKEWTLDILSNDTFAVTGKASMHAGINLKELSANANANVEAKVLGHPFKLVNGIVTGKRSLTEISTAKVQLSFVGKEVYNQTWQDKSILIHAPDEKSVRGISVRSSQKFSFAVGPVPMTGEVGGAGLVAYDWTIGLEGNGGAAAAIGTAQVDGFANVAADIEIARIGVGGILTLVSQTLRLDAKMGLKFDPATSEPQVESSIEATSFLKVLQGNIFAFVAAYVPTFDIPPFEEKQWSMDIFSWPGIVLGGGSEPKVIFSLKKKSDKTGYTLEGAPDPDDFRDMQAEKQLDSSFKLALETLKADSDTIASNTNEAAGYLSVSRDELSRWILDASN